MGMRVSSERGFAVVSESCELAERSFEVSKRWSCPDTVPVCRPTLEVVLLGTCAPAVLHRGVHAPTRTISSGFQHLLLVRGYRPLTSDF